MTPEIPAEAKKQFSALDWRKIAKLEWTVEDWTDYYNGISFALWKILRRHRKKVVLDEIDYQI